jgi:hypothetical protein
MAYNFVRANGSRVIITGSPTTAPPVTLSAWIRRDTTATGARNIVACLGNNDELMLRLGSTNTVQARMVFNSSFGLITAVTAGTVAASTWTQVAARFSRSGSTATVSAFINGVKGDDGLTTPFAQETMINAQIGSLGGDSTFGGDIAEVGIWNTALSDTEIISLSKGIACSRINPQNLRFYAPLIRNLGDIRGGRTMTALSSPTVSNHPRIYT